jgi:transmembrane sensor
MKSKKDIEDSIRKEWDETPNKGILPNDIKSRMWMNIQKATVDKRRRNYRWIAAASVALLLSVAGYQSFFNHTISSVATVATKTFPEDIRLLRLPDCTRVWVNQNTEIEYPAQFAENERTVTLKGEAFFEVEKDSSRPFIITSGAIKTTVLGTSFNVNAYAGSAPEVHVRTGKVKVESSENTVFLERGYAAVFKPESKILKKLKTNILDPDWKKVLIDVDGLTLAQVIEKLQPVHPFAVEYADKDLKNLKIKGTLDARQGFEEMLQTVAFALEVNIKLVAKNTYAVSK